ncbi:MAG: iron(III) transport system ATP-binding protein [Colwellia sp.]
MAVMHQGSILQIGRPADVCHSPNSWQVADFLQLGSWIPVKAINGQFQSAVGELPSTEDLFLKENMVTYKGCPQQLQLLLKSQAIVYCEGGFEKNNVKVDNISITEHGFHYLLSSIDRDLSLSFEQLSFYSNFLFTLGQKIAIKIKSHNYQVFNSYDDILG